LTLVASAEADYHKAPDTGDLIRISNEIALALCPEAPEFVLLTERVFLPISHRQ
jgi:hypothetical protein